MTGYTTIFSVQIYKLPANSMFNRVTSMSVHPILEAVNTAQQDVSGIRQALFAMHNLAAIFTQSKDDSPVYRFIGYDESSLRFPPSLGSVIYAAFHKEDDPEYFDLISEAVTGDIGRTADPSHTIDHLAKTGVRYDPGSGRIVPVGGSNKAGDRKAYAERTQKTPDYDYKSASTKDMLVEARRVVVGILNNPDRLTAVGREFGTYLFDLLAHIEENRSETPYLDDFSHAIETYHRKYISELSSEISLYPIDQDENGNPIERKLSPKAVSNITADEVYAYMACRMSEEYNDDVYARSKALGNRDPNNPNTTVQNSVQDTIGFVKDWVESEGLPDEAEYQTGEGRSEYIALNIENPELDLTGAPVAPEYLEPLFAKDCSRFISKRGGKKITDPETIAKGFLLIAKALNVPLRNKADDEELQAYSEYMCSTINGYIAQLATNVNAARQARSAAIKFLQEQMGKIEDGPVLIGNILRQVFQKMDDGEETRYPGVAGTGDEILLRKTSVQKGEITSRVLRAVKRYPGKFKVEFDDRKNGTLNIKMGNDTVKIDRKSPDSAHNYVMPTLFPYYDSSESFTTYAVWIGVTPYSRVVDNKLEYLIGDSEELHAIRDREGEDIASDAIDSVLERNSTVAMSGKQDFAVPHLSRQELVATLPDDSDQGFKNSEAANELDTGTLHAYSIMSNIARYDRALNQYAGSTLGETGPAVSAVRCAILDVYGNIPTMVSDIPSVDENNKGAEQLKERVRKKAYRYAAIMKNNGIELPEIKRGSKSNNQFFSVIRSYGKEFGGELFDAFAEQNIPSEISSAYNGNEHDALVAFRTLLNDLANTALGVVTGFGYHGFSVNSVYSGGKYADGNRMDASFNADSFEPIGRFRDPNGSIANERKNEMTIIRTAQAILAGASMHPEIGSASTPAAKNTAALANEADRVLGSVAVDQSAKETAKNQVIEAFGTDGEFGDLVKVYASVYSILSNIITNGPVTKVVNQWLSGAVDKSEVSKVNRTLNDQYTKNTLAGLEQARSTLRVLTGNGKLVEQLTDVFRGSGVGDEYEHTAYAELIGSAIGAMRSIHDLDSMKQEVADFFHTTPGKIAEMGDDNTVRLDDVDEELTAPEVKNGIGEDVMRDLGTWEPNGSGVYSGLTGRLGFDTIRVGKADGNFVGANPLTNGETAFAGLNKNAVEMCAAYIQSAREDLAELKEKNGPEHTNAMKTLVRSKWADEIIDYIGRAYMESDLKLRFQRAGNDILVDAESAAEWKSLVQSVIDGIVDRCADQGEGYLPAAASARYELLKFISEGLVIGKGGSLKDISKVSTAFAHIILRIGEMTKEESTPNPFAGKDTPVSDIPGAMQTVAKQRSMSDDIGTGDENARDILTNARNSVSDETLARELESIYKDFGMGDTEGSKRALDYFSSAIDAAENKLHRADSEINRKIAPNNVAAQMYGIILDSENAGDREYTRVKDIMAAMAGQDVAKTVGDLMVELALNTTAVNGPYSGKTYAGMAFGGLLANVIEMPITTAVKKQAVVNGIVRGIRYQIVDKLLSNNTFTPMNKNNPELKKRIAETFFKLAGNLESGHTATIFAALDPAERNAAHAARVTNLRDETNAEATLGANYDSDEYIHNLTGEYPDRAAANETAIKNALDTIMFPDGKTAAERTSEAEKGYAELTEIAGDNAAEYVRQAVESEKAKKKLAEIRRSGDVASKNTMKSELASRVKNLFMVNPRQAFDTASKVDAEEWKTYERLAGALYDFYTNRDSKNGTAERSGAYVTEVLGDKLGKLFLANMTDLLDNRKGGSVMQEINNTLGKLRAGSNPYANRIAEYSHEKTNVVKHGPAGRRAKEMDELFGSDTPKLMGSLNAQNRRVREAGGDFGTSYTTQYNSDSMDSIQNTVRKALIKYNVNSPVSSNRDWKETIQQGTGFIGSLDKFCKDVKDGFEKAKARAEAEAARTGKAPTGLAEKFERIQREIADEYASNPKNYDMAALRKRLSGPIGAVVPESGKTPMGGSIDEGEIRLLGRAGIPGINMLTDKNGDEVDRIQIGNSKPVSVDSPLAQMQVTLLVNKAEKMIGKSVFTPDGDIDPDAKKALSTVAYGNTAPVDPKIASNKLVPLVTSIIQRSMSGDTGKAWAKETSDGKFAKEYTDKNNNKFIAKFGDKMFAHIIHNIVGSRFSEATSWDIRNEIHEYLTQKKGTTAGTLPALEKKVKGDIEKAIANTTEKMVANGKKKFDDGNLSITWVNPSVPTPPTAPRKRSAANVPPKAPSPAPKAPPTADAPKAGAPKSEQT